MRRDRSGRGARAARRRWTPAAVERLANTSRLVVDAVIYAEVSERFSRSEDLDAVLPTDVFEREAIPFAAAFLAAKCFSLHRRGGGARTSPPPDLLIGAHAAVAGYRLLTRDAARFRTYVPKLEVIAPEWGRPTLRSCRPAA